MALTLQILHASDLEGGVDALDRAPNFAAIVDKLEDTFPNTIILSAGDNYLSGPFFSAAGDASVQTALRGVYSALYGVPLNSLSALEGRIDISIMNVVGFDASALGNHEFDLGTRQIADIINDDIRDGSGGAAPSFATTRWLGAAFPYLSSNLDFSADSNLASLFTNAVLPNTNFFPLGAGSPGILDAADLPALRSAPKIAPATIVDADGSSATTDDLIGIVGATTPLLSTISSPGATQVKLPGAGTNDMAALASILQPVINQVIATGINKVVLVTHLQQIQLEQELVPLLSGVDVVIAGGSDTLLADNEDVSRGLQPGDTPAGNYPIIVNNKDGNPTAIVSTDGEYSYVGRLVVEFDDNGTLLTSSINPAVSGAFATTDATVDALWGVEDPFAAGKKGNLVQQLTGAARTVVTTKDANILGLTNVFIEGRRAEVRTEETTLGNLTADANLAYAKSIDSTVVVSIKNGGGIRNPIGEVVNEGGVSQELPPQANTLSGKLEGQISQLDVENTLRFNNGLTLLTVTALELKQILEHGVAATAPGATPGQFPQVGGLAFSFDATKQAIVFDNNGNVVTDGQRIQSLAIKDEAGNILDVVVQNGQVVGDPNREIRIVTLNFLATAGSGTPGLGGDRYPLPIFGSNRVDLVQAGAPRTGASIFADNGSEQDALAEYLKAQFSTTPYAVQDTAPDQDLRIQNLGSRNDAVFAVSQTGTAGRDRLVGNFDNDSLNGAGGRDNLKGLAGDDLLTGGAGKDKLNGGVGNDTLEGEGGNDKLKGASGDDTLFGGPGSDVLIGSSGADTFVLERAKGSDLIRGFQIGEDKIGLTGNLKFNRLTLTQLGNNTLISFQNDLLATVQGVDADSLTSADFVKVTQ